MHRNPPTRLLATVRGNPPPTTGLVPACATGCTSGPQGVPRDVSSFHFLFESRPARTTVPTLGRVEERTAEWAAQVAPGPAHGLHFSCDRRKGLGVAPVRLVPGPVPGCPTSGEASPHWAPRRQLRSRVREAQGRVHILFWSGAGSQPPSSAARDQAPWLVPANEYPRRLRRLVSSPCVFNQLLLTSLRSTMIYLKLPPPNLLGCLTPKNPNVIEHTRPSPHWFRVTPGRERAESLKDTPFPWR